MTNYLDSRNFPCKNRQQARQLDEELAKLIDADYRGDFYAQLAGYQRILADNRQRSAWPVIDKKLRTLFMCGRAIPLDGPMTGIPLSIRDSDFFRKIAFNSGHERSVIASIEILATLWNATFADTGLWMGKTFEPVSRQVASEKCNQNPAVMSAYDEKTTRLGRNFFREIAHPNPLQALGLPTISQAWHLQERPISTDAAGFEAALLQQNLDKEKYIPYSKTGGYYLANLGTSVLPEMAEKPVYALNYRWPNLRPAFPMSCLIDEIVQIYEGIYLGQLIYATRHFSLGMTANGAAELGEPYTADQDYGYQNNGYFLMMDPAYASRIYAAFPQLQPRPGETAYRQQEVKSED